MERESDLSTKYLGKDLFYFHEINSTQLEIWRRIRANAIDNGTVIIADIQTEGKRNTWKGLVYG